jgi:hypothetical protein
MDKFLKVFVNDLNVHIMIWEEHLEHLWFVLLRLKELTLNLTLENVNLQRLSQHSWVMYK